jgi:hypothetical protein
MVLRTKEGKFKVQVYSIVYWLLVVATGAATQAKS